MRPRVGSPPTVFEATHPLVFAHRGGAKLAPENTLAAFARGMACGADGLELDVHLARDGVPVVIHDLTLERTTWWGARSVTHVAFCYAPGYRMWSRG